MDGLFSRFPDEFVGTISDEERTPKHFPDCTCEGPRPIWTSAWQMRMNRLLRQHISKDPINMTTNILQK